MSTAIATASSTPQVITKQLEVPATTLAELGLPTDRQIYLPVQIPVRTSPEEVATRSRQAVTNVILPAVAAGSTAAVAYVLGTGAIDAGLLQQFPANLTLATGVTAALATGSGAYALATLRQAAGHALLIPSLGMGRGAPQWILDAASKLRVGFKTTATLVSAAVSGAAVALATSAVGAAVLGSAAALSEPQTWIAAGVGAVAALGTFLFGRSTLKSARALIANTADEFEGHIATATLEAFKQGVREEQAAIQSAPTQA